ncbi:MAG: ketoacyl-ACP synthase III [Deltaproteobacteria bacterium]|nr:MAG: ketoacyl-ACP synthase III [Deltaproteobacteria bacterium]
MQRSRIVGTGTYLPARKVTNDDLVKEFGINTSDAWIRERTGIGARRIAAPDEATSDMATAASHKALEMAGIAPAELDMIVVGTVTPDMPFPSAAALVQAKIGAKKAVCFDVSAACAGSLYALSIADSFLRGGTAKKVLVIGAELLTRISDWKDRATCVLFGDAAGAMVVVPETRPDRGILSIHLYTDGTQADILKIPGGGSQKPFSPDVWEKREQFIKMNGREVYKTAVRVLEAASREALQRNGYQPKDVDYVIAHQANLRILDAVMKRLEIPLEKCEVNIDQVGNTSSASVPLTLDQANRAGKLKDGDLILMMAIGGGMAWGSALMRW